MHILRSGCWCIPSLWRVFHSKSRSSSPIQKTLLFNIAKHIHNNHYDLKSKSDLVFDLWLSEADWNVCQGKLNSAKAMVRQKITLPQQTTSHHWDMFNFITQKVSLICIWHMIFVTSITSSACGEKTRPCGNISYSIIDSMLYDTYQDVVTEQRKSTISGKTSKKHFILGSYNNKS